jgi:hypothetical protein
LLWFAFLGLVLKIKYKKVEGEGLSFGDRDLIDFQVISGGLIRFGEVDWI